MAKKTVHKDLPTKKTKSKPKSLSSRELSFIKHHLLALSSKEAAIRAGYSEKTAKEIAYNLLQKDRIKKEIARRVKSIITRADDKIAKMIEHLYICAYYDPSDILTDDGEFVLPLSELKEKKLTYAIAGIETKFTKQGERYTKITLADKSKSREQLGKYLQMFTDRMELTGKDGAPLPGISVSLPDGIFKKSE